MSQTCFVPSTLVRLFVEALNSSVIQHVVCGFLEVHKTSKDIVRGLHISKTETIRSLLMFPDLQVREGKTKKGEEIKVASDYLIFSLKFY